MSIQFKLVTPEGTVLEETVDSITLPAKDGEITVLPEHIPLVSLLVTGVITLRTADGERHLASSGGFVEVLPESRVTVFADTAERAEELTLEAVEAAKVRAEAALKEKTGATQEEYASAVGSLERELARLKAIRRHHSRVSEHQRPFENQ